MGIAIPFFLWDWAVTIGADPEKMDHWKNFDLRNELSETSLFPQAVAAAGSSLSDSYLGLVQAAIR